MNKLVKQILESKFNFNIDIEDNDGSISKSNHEIISLNQSYEECSNIVDLGLPSKTKWCKYNLGVDANNLFEAKDWYGGYYAWGETICNKSHYSWQLYRHSFSDVNNLTKYNINVKYGYYGNVDYKMELELEDDAAYLNLHVNDLKFRIPSEKLIEELIDHTTSVWIYDYNPEKTLHELYDVLHDGGISGLNGRLFIADNGNELFIPAAGLYDNRGLLDENMNGYIWSLNINAEYSYYAYCMYVTAKRADICNFGRYQGLSIRPVLMK